MGSLSLHPPSRMQLRRQPMDRLAEYVQSMGLKLKEYCSDEHAMLLLLTKIFKQKYKVGGVAFFPGRPGAKVAWEGRREPRRQPISWTDPMMWLKVLPPDEPDVLVCVRGVVLACA